MSTPALQPGNIGSDTSPDPAWPSLRGVCYMVGLLEPGHQSLRTLPTSQRNLPNRQKEGHVGRTESLNQASLRQVKLNEGKLSWEYSRAFKILSEAVSQTNCSKVENLEGLEKEAFEHREKNDVTGQKGNLLLSHPTWLAQWNDYRQIDWQQASLYAEQVNELNAIYAS